MGLLFHIYKYNYPFCNFYCRYLSNSLPDPNYNLHLFLAVLAKILKITIIIILSVFVVEILFKLVFLFKMFIRSKFEIFDAFIIVVSLGVNIFLLMNKKMVMSIGGLLTLFRLWRITEIVNGKGRVSSFIFFVA